MRHTDGHRCNSWLSIRRSNAELCEIRIGLFSDSFGQQLSTNSMKRDQTTGKEGAPSRHLESIPVSFSARVECMLSPFPAECFTGGMRAAVRVL
eukprot:scaffold494109_cov50-Prasinocladus_malaysianus.AAC.1